MKYLQETLRDNLYQWLNEEFQLKREDIQFSIPPNRKFGDLSTPIPFMLAKRLREKPFVIGNRIIEAIKDKLDVFDNIQIAGGGHLNFYFKKNYLLDYLTENVNRAVPSRDMKVVVEHTSINPNKAPHIGHLRNSSLGDTLVRSLRFLGYDVEIQNYQDDTGIQVADVIWGLMKYKNMDLDAIKKIDNLSAYLWELYPEVSKIFADDENASNERKEVHHKIEHKINPEYETGNYVAEEVLKDIIRVMDRLDIRYDLLVRESDIIALDFFKDAGKLMEEKGVMYDSKDPEKKGCKVVLYEKENIEKIIIRSNNTVTYVGKDIAYTLWKVGLFNKDFYYRPLYTYEDTGKTINISDCAPNDKKFSYGSAERVYNVIDVRQSYLQSIISQLLGPLSPPDHKKEFIHFSYEMVALTPRCVEEMGFEISEEAKKKSYVEVSGRKGIAVKAEDLIDKLIEKSLGEVKERHTEMPDDKALGIARQIAVGALRYFMIKFNANSVIAFDFKDALAFEGDTGPYLQYSLVRINSILRKLAEEGGTVEIAQPGQMDTSILEDKEYGIIYDMLIELSMCETQVEMALSNHDLSGIASYTFSLCQKFNHFYHLYKIMAEKDPQLKKLRLQLVFLTKATLEKLLGIMGMPMPEKM